MQEKKEFISIQNFPVIALLVHHHYPQQREFNEELGVSANKAPQAKINAKPSPTMYDLCLNEQNSGCEIWHIWLLWGY